MRLSPPGPRTYLEHLPVDLLARAQLLVTMLEQREPERFLRAEAEQAEGGETVVEQAVHFPLQRLVEIDENVAAQDDVELGERSVGHEVVLRENHVREQ